MKQTYAQEGKALRRESGGYAHAKQFKRLRKTVKRQRTILGVVMREVQRKLNADQAAVAAAGVPAHAASSPNALGDLDTLLQRAERFECLSVSRQVRPSSPSPELFYGGDNYSDAGSEPVRCSCRIQTMQALLASMEA